MLKSDLWDFSDAYIVVNGKITVADWNNDAYDKISFQNYCTICFLHFKNNAFIDNAEDLDVVMPM